MSQRARMSYSLLHTALLCAALGGCAQGFEGPMGFVTDAPGSSQGAGHVDDPPGMTAGMSGSAGMGSMDEPGTYQGDPCMQGESETCTCSSGGMGTRSCLFDAESPTMGSFSECMRCSAAGGGSGGSSGMGGSGGMGGGGTGGSSGSGGRSGSGGSGGSGGTSGSGGSGGSTAPPPPPSSGSAPGWCIFVPIPLPGVC